MGESEEEPLTREDVLKLIEEHGGKAKGLDLSDKVFEEEIDLRGIDLFGIILERATLERAHLEGAILFGAHLGAADLWGAHLEGATLLSAHLEGANLLHAHLEGAYLFGAHLEGAFLRCAHLEGARLWGVTFPTDTIFEGTDWGSKYILGEEIDRNFEMATDVYRKLKQWHTNAGMYDIAARFYYREMEARRKARSWREEPHLKLWSWVTRLLCGYGEKPIRVVGWAVAVVLGMAAIYSASALTFGSSLYYSAVSFTALGYGLWVPTPAGWVKGLGAAEAFIGVFMIALFLVTFTRKMIR